MDPNEENVVRKALGKAPGVPVQTVRGCDRKIRYRGIDGLIEDIEALYPAVNEVFIYDSNSRTAEDGPVLLTRNLRMLQGTIIHNPYLGTPRLDNKWRLVFVAVEGQFAYLKVAGLTVKT